jgi:hypothetical protein
MSKKKKIIVFVIMLVFAAVTWFLFQNIERKYEEPVPNLFWVVLVVIFFTLNYIKGINRFLATILFAIIFIGLQAIILINPSVYQFIYNLF